MTWAETELTLRLQVLALVATVVVPTRGQHWAHSGTDQAGERDGLVPGLGTFWLMGKE